MTRETNKSTLVARSNITVSTKHDAMSQRHAQKKCRSGRERRVKRLVCLRYF
ncbi:hypothetical protein WN48_03478 [Eufriesea mexicana]|uniref:Uncharacterized protein n=1 Tax=Eufriesea mexicana TaxID=516756 RepID=A0A310SPH3_9HYME|nr:hypothetical protein WN48_03478 [Eufriesea mexicana]